MVIERSNHGLEKALSRISADVGGAFSVALFELDRARKTKGALEQGIDRLVAELAEGDGADGRAGYLDRFLDHARLASTASRDARDALTARGFNAALIKVATTLREVDKCVAELACISSLTKITEAASANRPGGLASFIEALDSRCGELRASAMKSSDLVRQIQAQSGSARDGLALVERELAGICDRLGRDTRNLDTRLRAHLAHGAQMQDDARHLGDAVRRSIEELTGSLQFPDAFAQRAEHVRVALEALEQAADGDDRAALATVIVAQIDSVAADLGAISGQAAASMRGLARTTNDATIGQSVTTDDPSEAWMTASGLANRAMLQAVASARSHLSSAVGLTSAMAERIDTAQTSLTEAEALIRQLEISVHNASILATRTGSTVSPIRFLADRVREVVGNTTAQIARISEALAHIRQTSDTLKKSDLHAEVRTLEEIGEAASGATVRQSEKAGAAREVRRDLLELACRLHGAASTGAQAFEAAAALADGLKEIADELRPRAPYAGSERLDWLMALYTMEEERDVHRAALGIAAAASPVPVEEAEDDDLADFVF